MDTIPDTTTTVESVLVLVVSNVYVFAELGTQDSPDASESGWPAKAVGTTPKDITVMTRLTTAVAERTTYLKLSRRWGTGTNSDRRARRAVVRT